MMNVYFQDLDGFIKEYRNRQEDFILQYQDVCKVDGMPTIVLFFLIKDILPPIM